jgi:hypothetical protein
MRFIWLAGLLIPTITFAAPPPDESNPALARLAETATQLAAIPASTDRDDPEAEAYAIPPAAAELHRRFKDHFGEYVEAWLAANGSAGRTGKLRAGLWTSLRESGVDKEADDRHWFGRVSSVQVTRPPGHPHLLAVTLELSLGVSTDTALYLFETEGRHVRHLLDWSSEQALALDDSTRGESALPGAEHGFDHFDYRIAPRDKDGGFFLVVGWAAPRNVSNWGWVQWVILRPGPAADRPAVLTHGSDSAYYCFDECFSLSVDSAIATIEYTGAQGLDVWRHSRTKRHRIRVVGDHAEEPGPTADEPYGFVDDWVNSEWERALDWSNPANTSLADWHTKLTREEPYTEFGRHWVDACPPATSAEVVELLVTPDEGAERSLFLRLTVDDESFRLEDVTEQPPAGEEWTKVEACPDGP